MSEPILSDRDAAMVTRSTAHVRPHAELRAAQRFQGVDDLATARLMLALERGAQLYRNVNGRWYGPSRSGLGAFVSPAVIEMVRTGLLRHWRDREGDHLVPAKVHFTGDDGLSWCHFAGEGLGPMRARLVTDVTLVDCRHCLHGPL